MPFVLALFLLAVSIAPAFAVEVAGGAGPVPLDLAELWRRGDAVSQTTLLILAAMSVATWYQVGVKLIEQARLLAQARHADAALARGGDPLALPAALPGAGPFRPLALAALEALRRHQAGLVPDLDRPAWLSLTLRRGLGRGLSRAGDGLALLATIASTAPFVGLFGTVWSIHHALTEIGLTGQASIERVAGPVGESLVMTALGLAVAVPAVLAHNMLARRHKAVIEAVRGFAADLEALLLAGQVAASAREIRPAAARLDPVPVR